MDQLDGSKANSISLSRVAISFDVTFEVPSEYWKGILDLFHERSVFAPSNLVVYFFPSTGMRLEQRAAQRGSLASLFPPSASRTKQARAFLCRPPLRLLCVARSHWSCAFNSHGLQSGPLLLLLLDPTLCKPYFNIQTPTQSRAQVPSMID